MEVGLEAAGFVGVEERALEGGYGRVGGGDDGGYRGEGGGKKCGVGVEDGRVEGSVRVSLCIENAS